jgi:hypothetical protein
MFFYFLYERKEYLRNILVFHVTGEDENVMRT